MKIGLLSDAHGNPEGLERCLSTLRDLGAQKLYFLGDAVGYFSAWKDVLHLLRESDATCLLGNHDEMVLGGAVDDLDSSAYQFRAQYRDEIEAYLPWMRKWPRQIEVKFDHRTLLLVHGSPLDPTNGYLYPWSDLSVLAEVEADTIAMGHTHRPFQATVGATRILNVGSCGLPRDVGNLASCAIFDSDTGESTLYRVPLDRSKVLARVAPPHPLVLECLERRTLEFVGTLAGND